MTHIKQYRMGDKKDLKQIWHGRRYSLDGTSPEIVNYSQEELNDLLATPPTLGTLKPSDAPNPPKPEPITREEK